MFDQVPVRVDPALPVQAMQTYAIVSPKRTHTRRATCREVECRAYRNGWVSKFDVSTDLGQRQARYVRMVSGRSISSEVLVGGVVTFTFPAGQQCFTEHRLTLDREPLFVKRGGDWRAQTSDAQLMRTADWLDDFANHQDNLSDVRKRG